MLYKYMGNNIGYYARICIRFVLLWLFARVESARAALTWPCCGEIFSELDSKCPLSPVLLEGLLPSEFTLLHQFTGKLQNTSGAV